METNQVSTNLYNIYNGILITWGFLGSSLVKNLPANAGERGLIPGLERCLGEGNGNPLQYSCLGNPLDRRPWHATVHGVTNSWIQLNNWACTQELIPLFAVMWKDLECIMLSEASQREENKYCMLSLCGLKRKVKQLNVYVKTEKDSHMYWLKNKLVITRGERDLGREK